MKHLSRQSGAVLFTALIFLLILTLTGVTALQNSGLSLRMSANAQIRQMAFNAAESAMDQYISEYNYNLGVPTTDKASIDAKMAYLANYLPLTSNSYFEYCLDGSNSILTHYTAFDTPVTCGNRTLDGVPGAVIAKNRVTYLGCSGPCPSYSLGLGKQKISCHLLLMEAQGTVDQITVNLDQWVTLQGPC